MVPVGQADSREPLRFFIAMIALYLIAGLLLLMAIVSWAQSYLGAGTKAASNVTWEPADGLHVVIRYHEGVARKYKTSRVHHIRTPFTSVFIPKGFEFDGASIPFLLRPLVYLLDPWSRFEPAAAVHDLLYRIQLAGRLQADNFFRELMLYAGVPTLARLVLYGGVRAFGRPAWQENRRKIEQRSALSAQQAVLSQSFTDSTEVIA